MTLSPHRFTGTAVQTWALSPVPRRPPAQRPRGRIVATMLLAYALLAPAALAVQPSTWTHNTEADFSPGQTTDVVVTNLGDVKLAGHTEMLGEPFRDVSIIYDLQTVADGTLYIAAGPEAKLLRKRGDTVEQILVLSEEQVFCLDVTADGKLLLGISGAKSRLAVLEGETLRDLVVFDKVRYVWDLLATPSAIYVATGTNGRLLKVDIAATDGPVVTDLLEAAQANLLCLGRDGRGRIYAGTDTDGLIYRVTIDEDPTTKPQVFVMFDAPEPEIGALLVLPDGTVYAGTADAEQARPGRLAEILSEERGRPQTQEAPTQAPAPTPEPPPPPAEPGDLPNVPPAPEPVAPEGDADAPMTTLPAESPADENTAGLAGPAAPNSLEIRAAEQQSTEQPAAVEPTAEQLDELRQVVRRRLMDARRSGTLQVGPPQRRPTRSVATPAAPSSASRQTASAARRDGNAVYRINPEGFVQEIFRESAMILKLLRIDGKLLVATGNDGEIYQVDELAEETALLADLKPTQVPAMLLGPEGQVLLGTANPAQLILLTTGFAATGTYSAPVLDATQISQWGALAVVADIPEGAKLEVQTRSGNVGDPEKAAWSPWVTAATFEHDPHIRPLTPRFAKINSESARFLQYRLRLSGTGATTPVVDRVDLTYVVPNLKPVIKSIKASYSDDPRAQTGRPAAPARSTTGGRTDAEPAAPDTKLTIEWEASDPNNDRLSYKLEYQPAGAGLWLLLEDNLDQNRHEWETRRVPDGRYLIRVTASDAPDNPPTLMKTVTRTSDPVLIDNTPPVVEDLKMVRPNGHDQPTVITALIRDNLSPIRSVHYALNGRSDWKLAHPDDGIFDSTSERITVTIADLAPGQHHVVTLRAIDGRGNATYEALFLEMKPAPVPAAAP